MKDQGDHPRPESLDHRFAARRPQVVQPGPSGNRSSTSSESASRRRGRSAAIIPTRPKPILCRLFSRRRNPRNVSSSMAPTCSGERIRPNRAGLLHGRPGRAALHRSRSQGWERRRSTRHAGQKGMVVGHRRDLSRTVIRPGGGRDGQHTPSGTSCIAVNSYRPPRGSRGRPRIASARLRP